MIACWWWKSRSWHFGRVINVTIFIYVAHITLWGFIYSFRGVGGLHSRHSSCILYHSSLWSHMISWSFLEFWIGFYRFNWILGFYKPKKLLIPANNQPTDISQIQLLSADSFPDSQSICALYREFYRGFFASVLSIRLCFSLSYSMWWFMLPTSP